MRPSRSFLLLFLFALPCLMWSAFPMNAHHRSAYRVILISVDGLKSDAITVLGPEKLKNFYRLRKEGAFTGNARSAVDYTLTLPNHTGMITSRLVTGPKGHHWVDNTKEALPGVTLHSNKGHYLHSVFSVAHDHGLRTALFASKTKFSLFNITYNENHGRPDRTGEDNGRDKIDVYEQTPVSEPLVNGLVERMKSEQFDLLMVHIRNPDTVGHGMTWETRKPSLYLRSVKHADRMIGQILESVEKEKGWAGRTFVVVTADHGGLNGTHGHKDTRNPQNFTIPFFVWGPGIPAGADLYRLNRSTRKDPGTRNPRPSMHTLPPIRNAGAGNLCLDLLGLPPIPGSTVNANQDLKTRG